MLKKLSPIPEDMVKPDLVLPVPLHIKRLRRRGFNQASLLAVSFFPEEKKKIKNTILFRKRETVPQTGLNGSLRRKNIKNAFFVEAPEQVKGKNIVLIDDVFTTGTTVNECAKVLVKAGAKQVDVLTLARAEK
jgi:ComF family protein